MNDNCPLVCSIRAFYLTMTIAIVRTVSHMVLHSRRFPYEYFYLRITLPRIRFSDQPKRNVTLSDRNKVTLMYMNYFGANLVGKKFEDECLFPEDKRIEALISLSLSLSTPSSPSSRY